MGVSNKYDPKKHPKIIVEAMRNGDSIVAAAVACGVRRKTIYEWRDKYPEFAEAFAEGLELSQHWWETTGKRLAAEGGGNSHIYNLMVTNRFREDYKNKQDVEHTGKDGSELNTTIIIQGVESPHRDEE